MSINVSNSTNYFILIRTAVHSLGIDAHLYNQNLDLSWH